MSTSRIKPVSSVEIQKSCAIRYLPEESLHLWKTWDKEKSPRDVIPSHTPNSEYDFQQNLPSFPASFPTLDNLEIPFIRDKGVKFCIDVLGEFFGCNDYKFNLLQFWFLDILTDCLWTAQDDFHLPTLEQKVVLSWILYLIDLIRDPMKNLSRRKFFTVFKEAMLVTSEVVDEGCDTVPTPDQLFSFLTEEEELESWSSSEDLLDGSSLDIDTADFDDISCIELKVDEETRRYILPKEVCNCSKFDLSSIDSTEESNYLPKQTEQEDIQTISNSEESLKTDQLYQPDLNIPARFLPLLEELEEEQSETECRNVESTCEMEIAEEASEEHFHVYEVPDRFQINKTSDSSESARTVSDSIKSSIKTEYIEEIREDQNTMSSINKKRLELYNKKQIIKGLSFQKLWEQRLLDMENPRKGWIPTLEDMKPNVEGEAVAETLDEQISEEDEDSASDGEWAETILKRNKERIGKDNNKLIVNFGVLRAIINFVFKYFYQSFQFTLIKLAFQATPDVIFQKLNYDWKIPKKFKGELQKPKPEKKPKGKPAKKETPKKAKESKKSAKESKKTTKKSEKEKVKKVEKKQKPPPLTKEQKEELARQRKEQERIEEELRLIEEQKRFMYPLTGAATDDLFMEIFESWVKVDLTKKGKGGKKKK